MTKTIDGKFIFTHKGEDYVYFEDYVNLLQKVEKLKEKINTYENPEDLTLMFMWCDEQAKDKIKELQNKVEFLELSNPEQNIRHWEIINENRRKIGNLRKQIKDLKELEKEHQKINGELREDYKRMKENFDSKVVVITKYKEVIEEVRECIKKHVRPEYRNGRDNEFYLELNQKELNELLQILDKGVINDKTN